MFEDDEESGPSQSQDKSNDSKEIPPETPEKSQPTEAEDIAKEKKLVKVTF